MRYYTIKNAKGLYATKTGRWVKCVEQAALFETKSTACKYLLEFEGDDVVEVDHPSPEEQDWEEDRLRGRLDD